MVIITTATGAAPTRRAVSPLTYNPSSGEQVKPLRIAGLVLGGLIMLFSLGAWFPYLGSSVQHLGTTDSGPGLTNQDIVKALFGVWLFLWVIGLIMFLSAASFWLKRTFWAMIALTGAMVVVSGITALIGTSTG